MFDYFYGAQAEQFSFYRVPKVLFTKEQFKQLSAEAKILYGIMLDKLDLSVKNRWVDEKGRVYIIYTIEQIMADMNCADQKATKLLDELEKKCGLIERRRQGLGKPTMSAISENLCPLTCCFGRILEKRKPFSAFWISWWISVVPSEALSASPVMISRSQW